MTLRRPRRGPPLPEGWKVAAPGEVTAFDAYAGRASRPKTGQKRAGGRRPKTGHVRRTGSAALVALVESSVDAVRVELLQLARALRPGEARRAARVVALLRGGQLAPAVRHERAVELVSLIAEAAGRVGEIELATVLRALVDDAR